MPSTKKAGIRGRRDGRGGSNGGSRKATISSPSVPFEFVAMRNEHQDHSLQSEAFNTQRHQLFKGSDQRLRHTKIEFVSAGASEPLIPIEPEVTLAGITLDDVAKDLDGDVEALDSTSKQYADDLIERGSAIATDDEDTEAVTIDTQAGQPVITWKTPPHTRCPSFTPSNSSEEVIVYPGRDRLVSNSSRLPLLDDATTNSFNSNIREVEEKIDQRRALLALIVEKESPIQSYQQIPQDTVEDLGPIRMAARQGQHNRRKPRYAKDEDNSIDDYIANMEEHDAFSNIAYNHRELGDLDGDIRYLSSGDLSTPDDDSSSGDILDKPYRQAGRSLNAATWGSGSSFMDVSSVAHGTKPEVTQNSLSKASAEEFVDSGSDEDTVADGGADEINSETDFEQRKIGGMTDDSVARLLAKQEGLGMGSSELLLFDESAEPEMAVNLPRINRFTFPTSSAFTDAYDNFDVMDFNRPSLKRKGKGRRARLLVEVSDSEVSDSKLETYLFRTQENNRTKKKERKDERQALRREGLLGRKNTKPDLKSKYKEGMKIESVANEILDFLRSDNPTLALPPMDKINRKVVHELANAFNLKSKSAGNGNKRFPVLYKTLRSSISDEGKISAVKARLSRQYLPRADLRGNNLVSFHNRPNRGGAVNASVSYRDGDVVGASAPELGTDNKGRAMLEKMGWSTGTALGALNNKGILQPVSHIVKTTKAGLG